MTDEFHAICEACGADGVLEKNVDKMRADYKCPDCGHIWLDWSPEHIKRLDDYSAFTKQINVDPRVLLGTMIGLQGANGFSIYYNERMIEAAASFFDSSNESFLTLVEELDLTNKTRLFNIESDWVKKLVQLGREYYIEHFLVRK